MNETTIINSLLGLITVVATGFMGWWTTRGKADTSIKLKRNEDSSEITREYINAQATEIARLNTVIDHKDRNIEHLNGLLREVTDKLHTTALSLATKEVQYTQSLKDLQGALTDIGEMKTRVNTAITNSDLQSK